MAASSNVAIPIRPVQIQGSGSAVAPMLNKAEKSGQTFKQGVPVQIEAASGFVIECAAITSVATAFLLGFSAAVGANLTTSGTAKTLTTGQAPVNQSAASVIPLGAPINDGTTPICQALDIVVFQGVLADGANDPHALAQTDVGKLYGLTKDGGNSFWFVDANKTTAAGGACVVVTELVDAVGTNNGKVNFKVATVAQQMQ